MFKRIGILCLFFSFSVTALAQTSNLKINVQLEDALVKVDGEKVDPTSPIELPPREHVLEAWASTFDIHRDTLFLEPDQYQDIDIALRWSASYQEFRKAKTGYNIALIGSRFVSPVVCLGIITTSALRTRVASDAADQTFAEALVLKEQYDESVIQNDIQAYETLYGALQEQYILQKRLSDDRLNRTLLYTSLFWGALIALQTLSFRLEKPIFKESIQLTAQSGAKGFSLGLTFSLMEQL